MTGLVLVAGRWVYVGIDKAGNTLVCQFADQKDCDEATRRQATEHVAVSQSDPERWRALPCKSFVVMPPHGWLQQPVAACPEESASEDGWRDQLAVLSAPAQGPPRLVTREVQDIADEAEDWLCNGSQPSCTPSAVMAAISGAARGYTPSLHGIGWTTPEGYTVTHLVTELRRARESWVISWGRVYQGLEGYLRALEQSGAKGLHVVEWDKDLSRGVELLRDEDWSYQGAFP
jgi:hypothetical protein